MTHNVAFLGSHAALLFVKSSLESFPIDKFGESYYLSQGTPCILCCSMAFEALINEIFLYQCTLPHWDELKLKSKADVLFELKGKKIDWSSDPFQSISQLIKVRNWLSHHKEPYLGLVNGDGYWIGSRERKRIEPRVDILQELRKSSIQKYYNAVRNACIEMTQLWNYEIQLELLTTEQYEPLIM